MTPPPSGALPREVLELAERLLAAAEHYEERGENMRFARSLRSSVPDDESKAVTLRIGCDPQYEGCDELKVITDLLRESHSAVSRLAQQAGESARLREALDDAMGL
jgi:hypothetical protein